MIRRNVGFFGKRLQLRNNDQRFGFVARKRITASQLSQNIGPLFGQLSCLFKFAYRSHMIALSLIGASECPMGLDKILVHFQRGLETLYRPIRLLGKDQYDTEIDVDFYGKW